MRKVPQKAVFCVVVVLTLNVCVMEPMGFNTFLEDPKVVEIIEKGMERVIITADSDLGLIAGNGKITGLDPDKYYIVEERNENGTSMGVQFVSADGTRNSDLVKVGKVTGTEITGLKNFNTYKVKSAKPLDKEVTYYDQATAPPPGTGTKRTPSGGVLTLDPPKNIYYMEISNTSGYSIVKIPISPSANNSDVTPTPPSNIIKLEGQETVTDYVLSDNTDPENFYVLRVTVNPPPKARVTVTFSVKDGVASMTVSGTSITQAKFISDGLTLEVKGAPSGATYSWKYDNTEIATAATYKITFSENDNNTHKYITIGDHKISVEVIIDSVTYSKDFNFVVTIP